MATLAQYLDVDGYVLHITSALATTYTEGSSTYTLGNQDDSTVPGTVTASGIASHYAIVDVGGTALIEAGALASRQPVKAGVPFTIEAFEAGPKLIAQGALENAGAVGRTRKRRKRDETVDPLKVLSDTVAKAIEPEPTPEPEVEAASDPTPEPVTVDDDATVIAARAKVQEVIAEAKAKADAEVTAMRAAFEAAQQRKAAAEADRLERVRQAEIARQARAEALAVIEEAERAAELQARLDDEADAYAALERIEHLLEDDDDELAA